MTERSSPAPPLSPVGWRARPSPPPPLLPVQLGERRAHCPGPSRPSCSHCWSHRACRGELGLCALGPDGLGLWGPSFCLLPPVFRIRKTPRRVLLTPRQLWGSGSPPFVLSASCVGAALRCGRKVGARSGTRHLGGLHEGGLRPPSRLGCGDVILVGEGQVGHASSPHPHRTAPGAR